MWFIEPQYNDVKSNILCKPISINKNTYIQSPVSVIFKKRMIFK